MKSVRGTPPLTPKEIGWDRSAVDPNRNRRMAFIALATDTGSVRLQRSSSGFSFSVFAGRDLCLAGVCGHDLGERREGWREKCCVTAGVGSRPRGGEKKKERGG